MSILVGKIIGQRKIWVTTRTFVNFHSFFPDKVLILLTLTMSLFDGLDLYNLMLLKFFGIKLLFWKPINKNCKYFWFTKILFPLDSCFWYPQSLSHPRSRILFTLNCKYYKKKLFIIVSNIKTCLNLNGDWKSSSKKVYLIQNFIVYKYILPSIKLLNDPLKV